VGAAESSSGALLGVWSATVLPRWGAPASDTDTPDGAANHVRGARRLSTASLQPSGAAEWYNHSRSGRPQGGPATSEVWDAHSSCPGSWDHRAVHRRRVRRQHSGSELG